MTKEQNLIKEYLEWQNIPFQIESNLPLLMKISKGKMNPAHALGFWIYPANPLLKKLITNFYQVVDYIDATGGRYC
jgi:hypothetical protein